MVARTRLTCVDCEKEGLPLTRKATRPGPLCVTHRRARKQKTSEARWAAHILVTYNLTETQYWLLYEAQGGKCWICRRATGRTKRLSVDHDHKTGEVRQLLCMRCNRYVLGHLRDDPSALRRAADSIENPPARNVIGAVRAPKK